MSVYITEIHNPLGREMSSCGFTNTFLKYIFTYQLTVKVNTVRKIRSSKLESEADVVCSGGGASRRRPLVLL